MKKLYLFPLFCFALAAVNAQTAFQRVYTTLNTKCQNATCHSATSADALKFDGDENAVYAAIFNVNPSNAASIAKFEKIIKPQHPYKSFLLRKIAGAQFDTDLAIDTTTEGSLMLDINGQPLTNTEIEWIRQWSMFGALQTYGSTSPQPDYAAVDSYYTNPVKIAFLPKPAKPAAGTGMQLRMGPIFVATSGVMEREYLEQQEVNFPYLPEITEIDGFMNQQSHHFLLFKFQDSTSATNSNAPDKADMAQITPVLGFHTSFDGDKDLTASWQDDENMVLPTGTALMWDQKTMLDMNFHVKNYNSTTVLPCDFYFNVYFKPRDQTTIPMIAHLVNNQSIGNSSISCAISNPVFPPAFNYLPSGTTYGENHDDQDNGGPKETRYLWMTAGHTHQRATDFYLLVRDTLGHLADTIYSGQYDYKNGFDLGYWDHQHPPIEYWPNLQPVVFGGSNNAGLVASTNWYTTEQCIPFAFTTLGEMQLFYYMYTERLPGEATAVSEVAGKDVSFQVQPNPMNNSGKLVYVLDKSAKVEASIIDITGKVISHLAEENQQQGDHEIEIGGNELAIASGIYFARLTVDGNTYTKKFVVAK